VQGRHGRGEPVGRLAGEASARALELLARVAIDELRADARLRERDRLRAALEEPGEELAPLDVRAPALDAGLVAERRVPEREVLLAARGAVVVDDRDLAARERRGELAGIADRRAAEHVAELAAVMAHEPLEPAEHEGHVAAEDAAIGVQLVHDDVAEMTEETRPLRVLRQDAGVEHVGIGEDDVRLVAELLPGRGRGVAVVHARVQQARELDAALGEPGEALQLVLGERLRGKEVERGGAGLVLQPFEHRDVVAETLAARGPGHDDGVAARAQGLDRTHLVRVEPLDPLALEGGPQAVRQRRLEIAVAGGAPR
jgi:hypothetical protein